MKDEIKIEIQSEPGSQIQFGKSTDFRVAKTFNRRHLIIAVGSFVLFSAVAVVLGPPDDSPVNSTTPSISTPDYISTNTDSVSIEIEKYQEKVHSREKNQKRGKAGNGLLGPESLTRKEKVFFEPGTTVKGVIVSGGSLGFVKAKLSNELKNTPLKSGTILIGKAEVSHDRILLHFTKAVVDNKDSYALNAYIASPEDQEPGINISLWEKYSKKFGLTAGLYMVTGIADGLQSKESVGNQVVVKPTFENAVLGGVKTSTFETANDILSDQRNKEYKPNLKNDLPVLVVFDGEIEPTK